MEGVTITMLNTNKAYENKSAEYDKDAWGTPPDVFKRLDDVYHFTLDVCADANNHKCERYFDVEHNGLQQSWAGEVCFMNPPYSQVAVWLDKAYKESLNGAVVVCLVKSDTSTKWFRDYFPKTTSFEFLKRIQFIPPIGYTGKVGSPNMGSVVLVFGSLR
jgi:site-specific DNA-methyltransferase (adenine-specific)